MNKNRIFSLLFIFIFVFILSFNVFAVNAEETISAERLSDIKEIFTDVIKKSENHNFLYGGRDKETFPFHNFYVGNKYSAWFEKFSGTTPVDITSDADLSDENSELLAEYLLNFESGLEIIDESEYDKNVKEKYYNNLYIAIDVDDYNFLQISSEDEYGFLKFSYRSADKKTTIKLNYNFKYKNCKKSIAILKEIAEKIYNQELKNWVYEEIDRGSQGFTFDFENNKLIGSVTRDLKNVETLSFEVTPDDSYFGTELEEIAGGGSIKCTLRHYNTGGTSYYILELTGKGKSMSLYTAQQPDSNMISGKGYNNALDFLFTYRIKNETESTYVLDKYADDGMILRGDSDGKKITDIELLYFVDCGGKVSFTKISKYFGEESEGYLCPEPLHSENIEYEVYYKIPKVYQGINLGVQFGIPDGAITTHEFKADGNISEDQYYDHEATLKEKSEAEKEAEEKEKAEKESSERESTKSEKKEAVNGKEAAEILEKLGLMKGTQNGLELEKSFSRAEAATMLVRLSGKEEEVNSLKQTDTNFADMENHWAKDYVSYCYHNEITKGTSETTFSPEKSVTAEEYLTLVLRLMGYEEAEPENAKEIASKYIITDSEKLEKITAGSFNREKMAYISYMALVSQMSDGERLTDKLIDDGVVKTELAKSIGLK